MNKGKKEKIQAVLFIFLKYFKKRRRKEC